ncbi:serine/threonine-protein kinase [Arthrobacter castelli]|uniref:serine/threonine-protein kinase n=1 Tax=Arthrobacter castelli TaxID=271431 RepID=UPI0003F4F9A2|nr:serine/threonine-protein kinase [Arthrobacter castelli]
MSSKRPPAPPPDIPGFRNLSLLGSGGFSDVYLYEQDHPRRKVAIKVLLADLKTAGARRRFETEANLMAQLSSHPYIVTIFEAQITDDGHSYLAMEYCPRPSLDVRYRRGKLGVDEALAVGIQVASAVETAHRAGIAHRDIKPANILVTAYSRPALTDFGISGTTEGGEPEDDAGMSIPWSPPEAFHGSNADGVKGDIWALGATIYTLLAGRSPFVVPGGNNSRREIMSRIGSAPLPRLGRVDVPDTLELALATAMSKSPDARYSSAHSFALTLQRIQTDLNMSVTPFEVLDDSDHLGSADDDEGEATRVRQVVSIDPESTTFSPTRPGSRNAGPNPPDAAGVSGTPPADSGPRPPAEQAPAGRGVLTGWGTDTGFDPERDESTILRGQRPPDSGKPVAQSSAASEATAARKPVSAQADGTGEEAVSHSKRNMWLLICAAVVVVAAVVTSVVLSSTGDPVADPEPTAMASKPANAVEGFGAVPAPVDLSAKQADDSVTFTWKNPDPQQGDVFMWRKATVQGSGEYKAVKKPKVTVEAKQGAQTCIEVVIRRETGKYSVEPATACASQ